MKKELYNYLAHDLTIIKDGEVCILSVDDINKNFTPMLRPMIDLFNIIEHNGSKFCPMEMLCKEFATIEPTYEALYFHGSIDNSWCETKYSIRAHLEHKNKCRYLFYNITKDYRQMPQYVINKLNEWHFDYMGLIEKGEAIDKNIYIKSEPLQDMHQHTLVDELYINVGETVNIDGVELTAVQMPSTYNNINELCVGCYGNKRYNINQIRLCDKIKCHYSHRKDNNNIILKQK